MTRSITAAKAVLENLDGNDIADMIGVNVLQAGQGMKPGATGGARCGLAAGRRSTVFVVWACRL